MSAVVRLVDHRGPSPEQDDCPAAALPPARLLGALARRIAESLPTEEAPATAGGTGGAVLLHLDDLLADEAGEIVLRHGGSESSVVVLSPEPVLELGRAVPHITAAGENVSGCRYARFANGLVLYYAPDLRLEIVHATADDA